jgi:hypothetical protein
VRADDASGTLFYSVTKPDPLDPRRLVTDIRRCDLNGGGCTTVVPAQTTAVLSLALDHSGNKIYWTTLLSPVPLTGAIVRANMDGSNREELIVGSFLPNVIVIDPQGRKMYWSEKHPTLVVRRANLDGSEPETLHAATEDNLGGVAIDVEARKLYWGDVSAFRRSNLDGTQIETVLEYSGADFVDIGEIDPVGVERRKWHGVKSLFR